MVGQLETAGLTSFNRVGNAPRVDEEQTRTSLDARGVAHAVKRRKGAIQSWPTTSSVATEISRRANPSLGIGRQYTASKSTSLIFSVERARIAAEALRFVVEGGEKVEDFFKRFAGRRGEVGGEQAGEL